MTNDWQLFHSYRSTNATAGTSSRDDPPVVLCIVCALVSFSYTARHFNFKTMDARISTTALFSGLLTLISSCAPTPTDSADDRMPPSMGRYIEMKAVDPYRIRVPIEGLLIKCSGCIKFQKSGRAFFKRTIVVEAWPFFVDPEFPSIGIISFAPSVCGQLPRFNLPVGRRITIIGRLYDQNGVDKQPPQNRCLIMSDVQYYRIEE